MDLVPLFGLMEENTLDNGQMVNNMEEELLLKQVEKVVKVNGLMEKELDGWNQRNNKQIENSLKFIYIKFITFH